MNKRNRRHIEKILLSWEYDDNYAELAVAVALSAMVKADAPANLRAYIGEHWQDPSLTDNAWLLSPGMQDTVWRGLIEGLVSAKGSTYSRSDYDRDYPGALKSVGSFFIQAMLD